MPKSPRPAVPEPIKRQVRQRCGFGCVICGSPVYQYDHMAGIAQTGHDPDEMTLLCPMHHDEKTALRLPESTVREHNSRPYNVERTLGRKHPTYFSGSTLTTWLGRTQLNQAIADGDTATPIMVDSEPILSVDRFGDTLALSCVIRDIHNNPLFIIDKGELAHTVNEWDVTFIGQKLTVRSAKSNLTLIIRFEPPSQLHIERATIWMNGVLIRIGGCTRREHLDALHIVNTETVMPVGPYTGKSIGLWIGSTEEEAKSVDATIRTLVPVRSLGSFPTSMHPFHLDD